MVAIGTELIVKIAERYNNESMWKAKVPSLRGPPLLQSTWAPEKRNQSFDTGCGEEAPFAGIEIPNEWNMLTCGPPYNPDKTADLSDPAVFAEQCGGRPYTWGSRYWDGSPEQAWGVIANATAALKANPLLKGVMVGGPALISVMSGNQNAKVRSRVKEREVEKRPLN